MPIKKVNTPIEIQLISIMIPTTNVMMHLSIGNRNDLESEWTRIEMDWNQNEQ